jgi:DNA-binding XRE family transcriptional regulator
MKSDLKTIVRQHRKLSGLSQAQLAKVAGVGKTVIFDIEHGKESVQFDTL